MIKKLFLILLFIFLVGCTAIKEEAALWESPSGVKKQLEVREGVANTEASVSDENIEKGVVGESGEVIGPGGCRGSVCDDYFQRNPEESQKWCDENPIDCEKLKGDDQSGIEGPGNCGNNCEEYCDENEQECQDWCKTNSAKNPELCGFILMQENAEQRQGDGVWEKNELTFFIKDEENVLTSKKREVIVGTITSPKKIGNAFLGWNAALEELNDIYPDNVVPDRMTEIIDENDADIVIEVHLEREYCCDLAGLPVKGIERSSIDDNNAKTRSDVDIYNIVNMDVDFLEDVAMHELGHTLGLFGHVTDRPNDLMSIISPGRGIKKGNLNDLYVKYRDRIIETVDETRQRDQGVRDKIVAPPD
jgi:hypothetical protein